MRILTCIVLTCIVFALFEDSEAKKKISRKKDADHESRNTPVKKIKKTIPKRAVRSLAEIDETSSCQKNCEVESEETIENSKNFEDDMETENVIDDIEGSCSKTLTKRKKKLKKERSGESTSSNLNGKPKNKIKKNKYLVEKVSSEKRGTKNKKRNELKEERKNYDNENEENVDTIDAEVQDVNRNPEFYYEDEDE